MNPQSLPLLCGITCDILLRNLCDGINALFFLSVNSLKDQLEDMKKRNQNSQISNEKITQLQRQASCHSVLSSTPSGT